MSDKKLHYGLALILGLINWAYYGDFFAAISLLLCIEMVQADCWGEVEKIAGFWDRQFWWFGRTDTQGDLIADAWGLVTAILIALFVEYGLPFLIGA